MDRTKHKQEGITKVILKVIGLFSGLQIFNILCSIVKMKLVALWLHAGGVGLFGIYNSTIEAISTFTSLGMRQSSVRDISINSNRPSALAVIVAVVRHWSVVSGILGAIVMSAGAPFLAKSIFGDWTQCWGFVALSATMFFNALVMGEQSILQGTARLKSLAKASFWGTFSGLLVSIPVFYYLRDNAVIISIIVYSAFMLLFAYLFRQRSDGTKISVTWGDTMSKGKEFVKLGVYMSIAAFITNVSHLAFMAYLNRGVSTEEVGLFQAGYTLVIRYAGLIFTAVGMEFYPRLAANNHSPRRINLFVSHEITLLLLIVTPMIILFLLARQWIVEILYSEEFLAIIPFVSWAIMCNIFKAVSWCMAFSIIAKGDGKYYILTEGVDAIIGLALSLILYQYLGLTGVGIAYILWFLFYCIIVGVVYYGKYGFRLTSVVYRMILISMTICLIIYVAVEYLPLWINICLILPITMMYVVQIFRLYNRNKKY